MAHIQIAENKVDWSALPESNDERNLIDVIVAHTLHVEAELDGAFGDQLRGHSGGLDAFETIVGAIICSLVRRQNETVEIDYSDCPFPFDPASKPVKGTNDPRYVVDLLSHQDCPYLEAISDFDERGFRVVDQVKAGAELLSRLEDFGKAQARPIPCKKPSRFHKRGVAVAAPGPAPQSNANVASADDRSETNPRRASNPYDHSRPFDVHRWSDTPEVNAFVDDIFKELKTSGNKRLQKRHVKVILLDLYVAWCDDPTLMIAIARGNDAYKPNSRYNELHISKLTPKVLDALIEAGYIEQKIGFHDPTGQSRSSRVWPTPKLISLFEEAKFGPLDIGSHPDRETVILRDKDKNEIDYAETDETKRMRASLEAYNDLISQTFIDIPTLEENCIPLDVGGNAARRLLFINQQDKFTRRIFNRGSWSKGGRYFGGWWQRCPKDYRHAIFIDDEPVSEIDYSGLHMIMLYALQC